MGYYRALLRSYFIGGEHEGFGFHFFSHGVANYNSPQRELWEYSLKINSSPGWGERKFIPTETFHRIQFDAS